MKAFESRRMEVYAGMVDAMDHHIGRLISYLSSVGELDNTLVIFMSDNGAEGGNPMDWNPEWYVWLEENFDLRLENMGLPGSYAWTGPGWGHVSSTPYRMFKGLPTNGGILTPAIMTLPGRIPEGRKSTVFASGLDVTQTILDFAQTEHPGSTYAGRSIRPPEGTSLRPLLVEKATKVHGPDYVVVWELLDRRAVRKGDWKLVWMNKPWGAGAGVWSLYDLASDPTELSDVAAAHPEVLSDLLDEWDDYVEENRLVLIPGLEIGITNRDSHYQWLPNHLQ